MKTIHFTLILSTIMFCGLSARKPVVKEPAFYPCSEEVFWYAVMMAESGGKPDTCYREKGGTLSCGLYQISLPSSKAYGCLFKEHKDLLNPQLNTDCKNRIAAKLRLDGKTWDNSLARYWGVMRSKNNPTWKEWHKQNPNHRGYENLQRFAEKKGCIIR